MGRLGGDCPRERRGNGAYRQNEVSWHFVETEVSGERGLVKDHPLRVAVCEEDCGEAQQK